MRILLTALIVIAAVGAFVGLNGTFIVRETQQAIVLQFGDFKRQVLEPGLYFKIPFVEDAKLIEKRTLNLDTPPEEIIAAGRQRLVVDAYARFRVIEPLLFYQTVNNEAQAQDRLGTILNSTLRSVLAGETVNSLLSTRRSELMAETERLMDQEAERLGIDIVDVRITRADLPDEISNSIFERMRTEREREANQARAEGRKSKQQIESNADRRRIVLLAEAQRDSEIIRGQGDAERNRIFAQAFNRDPEFFAFYRAMQAYRTALNTDTTLVLEPDSEFFRYFNQLDGSPRR